MKMIAGLGNPGKEYEKNRHNAGFRTIDSLAKKIKVSFREDTKIFGASASAKIGKDKILLLKPLTFMNSSGKSVAAAAKYYKIKPENITIIHDDSDIPFGAFKLSFNKSSAGHRGVESAIKALRTQAFWRLRIGIRPKTGKLSKLKAMDLVLKDFTAGEEEKLRNVIRKAATRLF